MKGNERPVGVAIVFTSVSAIEIEYKIRMNNTNIVSDEAIDKFEINSQKIVQSFQNFNFFFSLLFGFFFLLLFFYAFLLFFFAFFF